VQLPDTSHFNGSIDATEVVQNIQNDARSYGQIQVPDEIFNVNDNPNSIPLGPPPVYTEVDPLQDESSSLRGIAGRFFIPTDDDDEEEDSSSLPTYEDAIRFC
jgi:hypothetical protein